MTDVQQPETALNGPMFRTAVRGYDRTAVEAAVEALNAECASLHAYTRDLQDELHRVQQLQQEVRPVEASGAEDPDDCAELTRRIEAILRPAQADAQQTVEEAHRSRTTVRSDAEVDAQADLQRVDSDCTQAITAAQDRAGRMLTGAQVQAEQILADADERVARAGQDAEMVLKQARRAMSDAVAEAEAVMTAQTRQQATELNARQAELDNRLRESELAMAEAEHLRVRIPEDAERKAQAIREAAQELVADLEHATAQFTAQVEREAELRAAELREHMDAIHEGLAILASQLSGQVPSLANVVPIGNYATPASRPLVERIRARR
jgi:hypothetical protein